MKTDARTIELWDLTQGNPSIDPTDLLDAINDKFHEELPDFRTRLLLRESLLVLKNRWGRSSVITRIAPQFRGRAEDLLDNEMGQIGFPTLELRVKERTSVDTILDFFRDLGDQAREAARLEVGRSIALILRDLIRRATDDIDVVNEVPKNIREKHELLQLLTSRHGLALTHFQSHFLPDGFEKRLHHFDRFGMIDVYLVDPLDIFVGKLCSRREKDLDDLRMLRPGFAMDSIVDRLKYSTDQLFSDAKFRESAERNWYLLYGQSLP